MPTEAPLIVGRYALYGRLAAGGMATVYIGRLLGPVGFSRTVAIKRLHAQFASDPEFVSMFLDEARLAARIQHPNVVSTLDVVATMGELFLVMEYVRGEAVSALLRRLATLHEAMPPRVAAAIASGVLQGLHAAHTATDEAGHPLAIVHRDISPQNVLLGADGTPRVLDFGVAKAENRLHSTRGGEIKGKLMYMPPEQLEGHAVDRTADIYATGLLLAEMLTGQKMFQKSEDMAAIARIMRNDIVVPSQVSPALEAWDAIVRRATARAPADRYASARAMAIDVERVVGVASPVEIADLVERLAGDTIKVRSKLIAEIESHSGAPEFDQVALAQELARSSPSGAALPESAPRGAEPDPTQVEASSPSRLSHAVSVVEPRRPGRRIAPVAVVAGSLVLAIGGAFAIIGRSPPSPAVPVVSAESPSSPASSPPPVPSPAASSGAVAQATPPPIVSAAATAEEPSVPSAPKVRAPAKSKAAPAKPSCDRPYTVDSAGHTHFRAECL
jgi:serine/threonine-protein kinase